MSDIIKSNFISFSDQKREIKNIDKNDPNVLKSSLGAGASPANQQQSSSEGLSLEDLGIDASALGDTGAMQAGNQLTNDGYRTDPNEVHRPQDESITLNEEHLLEIEALKEEGRNQGYEVGFASGKTDGYNLGYEEGKTQAEFDVNQALEAYSKEQDGILSDLKNQLIEEYSGYKLELEPKMLSIIEDLVVKIVGVQQVSKGTIMHLIKCGLDELELHGDLVIKVSAKDLDYVIERRQELTEELSEKIKVEILKDQQLEENECIIETEMGTIDCSLGTQLEGLLKELRLIKDSLLVD